MDTKENVKRKTTCFRCGGVSAIPCPYCGSTRKDCRVCHGDVLTCKVCDGRGYLEDEIILDDPERSDLNKC